MRGYQKKVIYVKNTGSRHFEEAYFVMRPDCDTDVPSSESMVREANRIIKENFESRRSGFLRSKKWHFLTFFLGAVFTLAVSLVLRIWL